MQIILIRHGSTAGNLEHRYVGSTDEPLTEQAKEGLKKKRAALQKPDLLFVSPMKRCRQTAALLYPDTEQIIIKELRECAFGDFEYKNYMELDGNADYQAWLDSGGNLPFPGGESRAAFAKRCCSAFEQCCRRAEEQGCRRAAFVVHGGTIMAVMERYAQPQRSYFDWQVKNAEGFIGTLRRAEATDCDKGEPAALKTWTSAKEAAAKEFWIMDIAKL